MVKQRQQRLLGDYESLQEKVFVVGNIGNPYTKEVEKSAADSVTVAEISSFPVGDD